MNKLMTITRDGKTIKTLVRQMAHDVQMRSGMKYKHGSGKGWVVVSVEEGPEYNPEEKPSHTGFVDISSIQEYGLTQKLSNAIRVF